MQPMKSSASKKNTIPTLVRENLRKFWPISLVSFLILFLSSVLPAMLIRTAESKAQYVMLSIKFTNPAVFLLVFLLPIIASVAVFRYNCTAGQSAIMHSLPMTKKSIFTASYLSGMIIAFAPMLLSALTLLPFIEFSFNAIMPYQNNYFEEANLTLWSFWVLSILVIELFVFSISTLSSMIAGNTAVQILLSCVLNFIVLIMYALVLSYLTTFLLGFTSFDSTGVIALHMHPLPLAVSEGVLPILASIVYVIISAIIVLCSYRLYKIRKVERIGNSIVFRPAEHIVSYLLTLLGMAAIGILFYLIYPNSMAPFFVGSVFGAIISFIIVSMIMQKTPRIFNIKTLKKFGVFVIIAVVFITSTVFDVTGFSKRIPNPGSVERGTIVYTQYPFTVPYGQYGSYNETPLVISKGNPEDVLIMIELHEEALNFSKKEREENWNGFYGALEYTPDNFYSDIPETNTWRTSVTFSYDTGGFSNLERYYNYKASREAAEKITSLSNFKADTSIEKIIGYSKVTSIDINPNYSNNSYNENVDYHLALSARQRNELLKCFDEDYKALATSEMIVSDDEVISEFIISYKSSDNQTSSYYREDSHYKESYRLEMYYSISDKYIKTIEWLKANELYNRVISPESH